MHMMKYLKYLEYECKFFEKVLDEVNPIFRLLKW